MSNKNRRVILLEEMYRSIASKAEIGMINDLYAQNAKGTAVSAMMRRVYREWWELIESRQPVAAKTTGSVFQIPKLAI